MEDLMLVLMLWDGKSHIFEKEIALVKVEHNQDYLVNAYCAREGEEMFVHMKLSCEREVEDWAFDAIYDYYDGDIFSGLAVSFTEVDDVLNPTWEIVFPFTDNEDALAEKVRHILEIHVLELKSVYEAVEGLEEEYKKRDA